MNGAALAIALALPIAAAWFMARWLGVGPRRSVLDSLGLLAAAVVGGIGASSVVAFAWMLAGGALDRTYAVADAVVFGFIASATARAHMRRRSIGPDPSAQLGEDWIPVAALCVAVLVAVGSVVASSAATPDGGMDAWMMWNLRARFIVRAGHAWRIGFSPELAWTSTEYPLLLPLAIARLWAYAGETAAAPAAVACAFTAAVPLALAASVGAMAGPSRGVVPGLLLLGSPGFVALGASQYADVPLAAALVSGLGAIMCATQQAGRARSLSLAHAGFLLGLAGWTKNEGVAVAAIAVGVQGSFAWRQGGVSAVARDLASLFAGATIPAGAWVAFHGLVMRRVAGALFFGHTASSIAEGLGDGGRWATILGALARCLPGWTFGLPLLVLSVAVLFAARAKASPRSQAVPVFLLMSAVHVAVFLVTTFDLAWHLRFAADRIVLQEWPLFLVAAFAVSPRPPAIPVS